MSEQMIIRPPEIVDEELQELRFKEAAMKPWDRLADDVAGLLHTATGGRMGHSTIFEQKLALMIEQLDATSDEFSRKWRDAVEE